MSILQDISTNLQIGKAKIVKTLVQQALDEGISAQDILSQGLLDGMKLMKGEDIAGSISTLSLLIGFIAAFVSGCLACKWMINIVKKGKLIYFAVYCAIAGIVTLVLSQMQG